MKDFYIIEHKYYEGDSLVFFNDTLSLLELTDGQQSVATDTQDIGAVILGVMVLALWLVCRKK